MSSNFWKKNNSYWLSKFQFPIHILDDSESKALAAFVKAKKKVLKQTSKSDFVQKSSASASASAQLRGVTSDITNDCVGFDVLIGRLKAKNTLENLKKANDVHIHSPKKCKWCRFVRKIKKTFFMCIRYFGCIFRRNLEELARKNFLW